MCADEAAGSAHKISLRIKFVPLIAVAVVNIFRDDFLKRMRDNANPRKPTVCRNWRTPGVTSVLHGGVRAATNKLPGPLLESFEQVTLRAIAFDASL